MAKTYSPRIVALISGCLFFMEQLDGTILATSLPQIASSLHVDPVLTSVALTAYIVGLAIFIPASGALADRFGTRTVMIFANLIFTTSSFLCASSHSLIFLSIMRVIQGIGGALMVPVGRLTVVRQTPDHDLVRVMTWMMLPATVGPLMGPIIGGFITTQLSWRWNFYINIPIGIIGFFLTLRFIPQIKSEKPYPFDMKGMCLAGGGMAILSLFAEFFSHDTGTILLNITLLMIGLFLLIRYVRHARHTQKPLINLKLLDIPTFRVSLYSGALSRVALGSFPFLFPSFLEIIAHETPEQAGLVIFFAPLGNILTRPFVPAVLKKWGFRTTLSSNGIALGAIFLVLAYCCIKNLLAPLPFILFVGGMIQSIQFSAYNTIAYADVSKTGMSSATSFYDTMKQIMLSVGICTAATVLTILKHSHHVATLTNIDFAIAFCVTGTISFLATPICLSLSKDAGAAVSGHR